MKSALAFALAVLCVVAGCFAFSPVRPEASASDAVVTTAQELSALLAAYEGETLDLTFATLEEAALRETEENRTSGPSMTIATTVEGGRLTGVRLTKGDNTVRAQSMMQVHMWNAALKAQAIWSDALLAAQAWQAGCMVQPDVGTEIGV